MNDTIGQNGVSSSQLSGHRHHGSIPNTPTRRDEPHGRNSSGLSNRSHQPVSDHAEKESERIQSRAVLLKLLQPPGNSMLRSQSTTCSLPYQQTADKTLLKSDLCGSHCLRCTDFQQAARNSVDIGREVNDEWRQKTMHSNCINPDIKRQNQNISTNREATERHFRDHETVLNLPCPGENLSRMDNDRTGLPLITVRCQSCEARARPFHSEESQSRPDRCQHFPADRQQYSNGHTCFRKDSCTHDSNSVPYIAVQINKESQRKDEGSLKQMCPPTWRYKGYDSWMCQRPPLSNQTLVHEHPEMGVTGAGKRTIPQNTDRSPDHLRRAVESGRDSAYQTEERTHQDPSTTTQYKVDNHKLNSLSSYSMGSSESYRREPFCPPGELGSPAVRMVNGQEHRHEERNIRLEQSFERDHRTISHSPNDRSAVLETQSDECTPVIVQCYSLSTVSSTLEPTSMSDSQFMNRREPDASVNIRNNEDPTVLASHSRYLYQQHSPRSLNSANRLQSNEDFLHDSPVPGPRRNTNPHSHNFMTQPKHTINESSTSEIGIDDEEKQTRDTMLPEQFHKRRAIPANCPCVNCQQGHHAFKNGYDGNYTQTPRRDHHPFNDQWTEPHRNTTRNGSQQKIVHAPNDHQMTCSAIDFRNGHESGETFPNWQTRKDPRESRPALKIHDYYEERRILVGTVYQNIPGSVESSQVSQTSTSPYARPGQLYQKEPYQNSAATSVEVLQTHPSEESALQICAHHREIAVGSKKRKSRQPRPQRVKTNDPTLAREKYQHPIQHAEDCHEDFSHNNYHHQASSPFQHNASVSTEASRKRREEVEVLGNESEANAYKPVHESTDPVQHESATRRGDHVFESNSSRPEYYRSEFPLESRSPRRTFYHQKRHNTDSSERNEQFVEFPRGPPDVPSYGPVGRHDHANHISREHQLMNSYCESKTPEKCFAYSNDNFRKRSFHSTPERNAVQQHRLGPKRMRGPENHIDALEKIRSGYDSADASCSSRKMVSYSSPSQRNMPAGESVTSQFERNSKWNDPATSVQGVHQGDNFYHHAVPAKGKSPHSNSEPSDNVRVSSTTVGEEVELQAKHGSDRPFQSVQTTATTDRGNRPMKEQDNRVFFLHTRDVWADHMSPAIKERKFVCRYCSKKFAHFSTLQNHLRTHTGDKPFQCKFCNRRFAQSGVLKAHLRTHTGDKPFACMYCGKMFAQSTTLTNHLRTHTGHKPYVCQFCSKSFSQPSTLRKHELSHTKERPYPCKFCGKAFAQQSTLTNHLRSHTGQRPYKCHFCEKSFAQLSTLDRHLRLHSNVSHKPYQCRHCSKSFSYFSNLSSHMQSHEQEQT